MNTQSAIGQRWEGVPRLDVSGLLVDFNATPEISPRASTLSGVVLDTPADRPAGEPTRPQESIWAGDRSYDSICFDNNQRLDPFRTGENDEKLAIWYPMGVSWTIRNENDIYQGSHDEHYRVFCTVPPEEALNRIVAQQWDNRSTFVEADPDLERIERLLGRGLLAGTWALESTGCPVDGVGPSFSFSAFPSSETSTYGAVVLELSGNWKTTGDYDARFSLDPNNSSQGEITMTRVNRDGRDLRFDVLSWSVNRIMIGGELDGESIRSGTLIRCGRLEHVRANDVYPGLFGATYILWKEADPDGLSYWNENQAACAAVLTYQYARLPGGGNFFEESMKQLALGYWTGLMRFGSAIDSFFGFLDEMNEGTGQCQEVDVPSIGVPPSFPGQTP